MSDTRVSCTPGWGPQHPRWPFGPMTAKRQAREKRTHAERAPRAERERFSRHGPLPEAKIRRRNAARDLAAALADRRPPR
ncbi:MAG: hypothetical protein EKK55_10470 [Rhodocyclaceae bacterium]|nr:MAG: hypothetical protein EKK55_10470 [Rhodocyclaceae bacterium]